MGGVSIGGRVEKKAISMKWLFAILAIPVAAFCTFGFLASFEPVPNAMVYRTVYAAVGAIAVGVMLAPFIPRSRSREG